MDKNKFYEIVLDKWVPALITATIGGLVIAYLAPKIQTKLAGELALNKRKLDLWESVGSNFTDYIQWRSRLISLSQSIETATKAGKDVAKGIEERQEQYRMERDKSLDTLRRDLLFIHYYYGKPVEKVVNDFLTWHQQFARVAADKLPPSEDYTKWRETLLKEMRAELY